MKKLILTFAIFTTLLSCKKQETEIYYKYAYIDARCTQVVTTHLIPVKTILTDEEINERLNQYRQKHDRYILNDTIVHESVNTVFLLKKYRDENGKPI
jgi:hypothetical protein